MCGVYEPRFDGSTASLELGERSPPGTGRALLFAISATVADPGGAGIVGSNRPALLSPKAGAPAYSMLANFGATSELDASSAAYQ